MITFYKLNLRRSIAAAMVAVVFYQEVGHAASFAAPASSAVPKAIESLLQDPGRLRVPAGSATLKEIHKGAKDTLIIHIQDPHSNFSGQENLARALDEIMRQYGVYLVFVEGGSIDGTLTPLKRIASAPVTKRVARSLLMDGKIAGEEYLNLTTDHPMKILGVEDMDLYMQSVRAYERLSGQREAILDYLKRIRSSVDKLKSRMYPQELLAYEKSKGREPGMPVGERRFEDLVRLAGQKGMDEEGLPNVRRLKDIQRLESDIDFDLANLEQATLADRIRRSGAEKELESSLGRIVRSEDQKASQLAYFKNLFEIAERKSLSLEKYPNLRRYVEYLQQFASLDIDRVLDELVLFEDRVYAAAIPAGDARLVRAVDRYLQLLETAYQIRMSAKEFAQFLANEPDFSTPAYLAFINRKLVEQGYFEDLLAYRGELESGRKALGEFYDSVHRRDLAFVYNAERILGSENQSAAVLITGGYHTSHLKSLLQQRGYSYAVLTPIVTQETNQSKYEKLLLSTLKGLGGKGPEGRKQARAQDGPAAIFNAASRREQVRYLEAAHRFEDVLAPLAEASGLEAGDARLVDARRDLEGRAPRLAERLTPAAPTGARLAEVPTKVVAFFPGLGSRDAYKNLGSTLYDTGVPEVQRIYREAAEALGLLDEGGRPDPSKIFFLDENIPADSKERGGFIGAAFVVHNLALHAYYLDQAKKAGITTETAGFTGESFGILTAAIASGAISVKDGIRFARQFTPCLVGCADESVAEDFHVIGIRSDQLARVLKDLRFEFPDDVEVHKFYSDGPEEQVNVYVSSSQFKRFQEYMTAEFPSAEVKELKAPTKFIAHSKKMSRARNILDNFLQETGISFEDPSAPIISNNGTGVLRTAMDVARAVLAIVDEPMHSSLTVREADAMGADVIIEFGLGGKTKALIDQNYAETPFTEYTGQSVTTSGAGFKTLADIQRLREELEAMKDAPANTEITTAQYDLLRAIISDIQDHPDRQKYLFKIISKLIKEELIGFERRRSPVFYKYLEIIQNTYLVHFVLKMQALASNALVLSTVFKRRVEARDRNDERKIDIDLWVLDRSGTRTTLRFMDYKYPESVTFSFGTLPLRFPLIARRTQRLIATQPQAAEIYEALAKELGVSIDYFTDDTTRPQGEQYSIASIAYQYVMFKMAQLHRPAIFGQNFYYLTATDSIGAFVALAAGGSLTLAETIRAFQVSAESPERLSEALAVTPLKESKIRIIDPTTGAPIKKPEQVQSLVERLALRGTWNPVPLDMNFQSWVVSLDPTRAYPVAGSGVNPEEVIHLGGLDDLWRQHVNVGLDVLDQLSILRLTDSNGKVYRFAEGRGTTTDNVYAYIEADEQVVGFGSGGSESLTVFVRKPGETQVTVRKVLSERLITAQWDEEGKGVMMPPFKKAKQQAYYLQGLPEEVGELFPRVFDIRERKLAIPEDSPFYEKYKGAFNELIYDMSFVGGIEVSEFVRRYRPSPEVVARLYREIFRVLHTKIHSLRRAPRTDENTLEESYFKKIEDRLALSQRTSPSVFNDQLLHSETIVIDGREYLNVDGLLRRFRQDPRFREILEPRFHALVMGDTNTENIKISNIEPILTAMRTGRVDFTAEEIGIKFLDPRAIGYKTAGSETIDDPMYDNKPWHNSLGNYDAMHGEHFDLDVELPADGAPRVGIRFHSDNPYVESYRDIEKHFARVMTEAWDLSNEASSVRRDDPYWLIRFAFMMGTHFTAMPPFHFSTEIDGTRIDDYQHQRRPVAIYAEGIKWLNLALDMLEGRVTEYHGIAVPELPYPTAAPRGPPSGDKPEFHYGARLAAAPATVTDPAFSALAQTAASSAAFQGKLAAANVRLVRAAEGPRDQAIDVLNEAIERWTAERGRVAEAQRPFSESELLQLIERLVRDHRAELDVLAKDMDDAARYPGTASVGLGGRPGQPTVFVNSWAKGTPGRIHDHGRSKAAYQVYRGLLSERQYYRQRGGSYTVRTAELAEGSTVSTAPPYIHQLENGNPDGTRTVTINAYSPQLVLMNRYAMREGRLAFSDQWVDDEVVHEITASKADDGTAVIEVQQGAFSDWRKDEARFPGYSLNALTATLLFGTLQSLGFDRFELIKKGYGIESVNALYLRNRLEGEAVGRILQEAAAKAFADIREGGPLGHFRRSVPPRILPAAPEEAADVRESGARLAAELSPEVRAFMSPWIRIVRGTGLGQHPTDFDPEAAANLRKTFGYLKAKVGPDHEYNNFSEALTEFILSVVDPAAPKDAGTLSAKLEAAIVELKKVGDPYRYVTASSMLFEAFAKLGLDPAPLVNDERDLVGDAISVVGRIPAEANNKGSYERMVAAASLILAVGELGYKDRLTGPVDTIGQTLDLLSGIESVYYRGRGASSLFSAVAAVGFADRITDGPRDHAKELLDYMDEKLDKYPKLDNMRLRPSYNTYPLLTVLNALAMLNDPNKYITYRREWLNDAEYMFSKLPPSQQMSQGQYYLIALINLGQVERYIPDVREFFRDIFLKWEDHARNRPKHVLDLAMHDTYAVEVAQYFGMRDMLQESVLERLTEAYLIYKGGQDTNNTAYSIAYGLTALSEVGQARRLFTPNPKFGGEEPMAWTIRNFSEGIVDEKVTVTFIHHALVGAALQMRGEGAKDPAIFDTTPFLSDRSGPWSEEREYTRASEEQRIERVRRMVEERFRTALGALTGPIEPLGGGFQAYNRPFKVVTEKGTFVIKRESASRGKAEAVIAVSKDARAKGLDFLVEFVADDQGEYLTEIDGHFYSVQKFAADGVSIVPQTAEPVHWRESVKAAAQLHAALKDTRAGLGVAVPPHDPRSYKQRAEYEEHFALARGRQSQGAAGRAEQLYTELYPSVAQNLDILERNLSDSVYLSLPTQLIDADLRMKNMFFDADGRLAHLFDFGHAGYAPRVRDFVGLFVYNTGVPFDYDRLVEAAAVYNQNAAEPLSDAELRAIPEMLRGTWLRFIRLFFWDSDQFGFDRLNSDEKLFRNVELKLNHMQGIPAAFPDDAAIDRFVADAKSASAGARLAATAPVSPEAVLQAEPPFRLVYGAVDQRVLSEPSSADQATVFQIARLFAAKAEVDARIPLKFDQGVASISLEADPRTRGAAIVFYDVNELVAGRQVVIGRLEIAPELIEQAAAENRRALEPAVTGPRAEDVEFLDAVAETARQARDAARLYGRAASLTDASKPVILRVVTGSSERLSDAARGEVAFLAAQKAVLRAVAGENVFVEFGYLSVSVDEEGAQTSQFIAHDTADSDSVPAEVRRAASVVAMGELSDAFVRMASSSGSGVAAIPPIGEGQVLPFISGSVFSVLNARSDPSQSLPELSQLWANVRSQPTELTPQGRSLLRQAPPEATVEMYRPYTLRAIAKIAIDKFISFAQMALQAIGASA